jgi:hypothetical protein
MTEIQSLDLQRSGFAQLRSLCTQIVQTDSGFMNKDMIRDFLKPLSKILIDLGLFEWFYKALASCRPPRTRERSSRGKEPTRQLPAKDVGSMISLDDTNTEDDRHPLHHTSVETRILDVHPRPYELIAGAQTEERFFRETMGKYNHFSSVARQEIISQMKNDPQTLLAKLCPLDKDRLKGSDLERLLEYRSTHGLSDEVLFRYYDGARSLNESDFKLRISTWGESTTGSTGSDTQKTPQGRVLETLQRNSKQATDTVIESRYYKLALYCQIENIRKELLKRSEISTRGVSFQTMARREWIKRSGGFELEKDSIKSWRKQGEKWKILCDSFTLGILEASHEALDAW